MNPRYAAYLKTTDKPTNWDFMAFINKMVAAYAKETEGENVDLYWYSIDNQDAFTSFIERQVNSVD